ncbi:MAG: hypothetical protein OXS29_13500 [bacterium]|nr:hypothetical protein [bacterium]MDE0289541.1 hypothetical protein [bacterium]MDE0437697.1 hypothetical protein [bacterium]
MFDVVTNLMIQFRILTIVAFSVAVGAMIFIAYVKTRSTPAVLGIAVLGVGAILLVANITTVVNLSGSDVFGTQHAPVSTPGVVTTVVDSGGSPSPTTTRGEFGNG